MQLDVVKYEIRLDEHFVKQMTEIVFGVSVKVGHGAAPSTLLVLYYVQFDTQWMKGHI